MTKVKSLLLLPLLACAGLAAAQSSASVFGVVDLAVTCYKNGETGASATSLDSGGQRTSRFGFRGTEDLGNGLKLGLWLEGELNIDRGEGNFSALDFKRRSTISLMGNWGEFRAGRDKRLSVDNADAFDPFNTLGKGLYKKIQRPRASNMIAYMLPHEFLGGLYGGIQYQFGEAVGSTKTDSGYNFRLGYKLGKWNINGNFGRYNNEYKKGDVTVFSSGVLYDLKWVKPFISYGQEKNNSDERSQYHHIMAGGTAPLGNGELRFTVNRAKDTSDTASASLFGGNGESEMQYALGYSYNLSKRTELYTNLEYVHWSAFKDDKGIQIGIAHRF